MSSTSNTRIQWIDFARALAIISVVLCHAVQGVYGIGQELLKLSDQSFLFCFSAFTIGRLGVPLFLMITGSLILTKEYNSENIKLFWKNKWLHLFICTLIWFIIYELFLVLYSHKTITPIRTIQDLLFINKVNMSHAWYLPMILGIYILLPFVAGILNSYDKRILLFPLSIYTLFAFGFPLINVFNKVYNPEQPLSNQFSLGFSGGVYGIYIIFGYLVKIGIFKKIKTGIFIAISIVFYFAIVLIQIWSYKNGVVYNIWYDNVLLLIVSLCLFELISRIKTFSLYSIIKIISIYSFPIYLIHYMIRMITIKSITSTIHNKPFQTIILGFICFSLSLLVSFIISKIPKIGKYLLYM